MSATTDNVLVILGAALPGAVARAIKLALHEVTGEFCRDVLQVPGPTSPSSDIAGWMPDAQWIEHHRLIIDGTLARMYGEPGRPYSNPTLAQAHLGFWTSGLAKARSVATASATAPNTVERIMNVARSEVPGARDGAIQQALFLAVDELNRQVLQATPPVQTAAPSEWLTAAVYAEHQRLLIDGVLHYLFGQTAQPWANPENSQFHLAKWMAGLTAARTNYEATAGAPSAPERIMSVVRVEVPGARDGAIQQALFQCVDRLARAALQVTPPTQTAAYNTWLPAAEYAQHHGLLIQGTLAILFAQVGQPWFNEAGAQLHGARWEAGLSEARTLAATMQASTTAFSRLMANLRSAVPGLRDDALQQEVFNVVDDLTRNILQTTPPNHGAQPEAWLTPALWDAHYRLIFAGAMVRILTQPGKPWTDPALASIQQGIYSDLVTLARGDANSAGAVPTPIERIMDNLRVKLPGSKDSVIHQELFNTIDELCRVSRCWRQNTPVRLSVNKRIYDIAPLGTDVIEVISFQHETFDPSQAKFNYGGLYVHDYPAEADTHYPAFVTMHLAPSPLNIDPEDWLPVELLMRHVQTLVDGVCMRMMLQIGKPYSNPAMAQYHGRRFRNALAQATIDMRSRDVAGQPTWQFPRFAR